MMLSMYTDSVLAELKTNYSLNKEKYINGEKFVRSFIKNYDSLLYPLDINVEYPILDLTIANKEDSKKQWEIDCENAINLHKNFVVKYGLSMQILSDERFIAFLTHDIYFEYMIKRWPVSEKTESRIKEKYFLPSGSQAFTRNMFLRFFWYCYVTFDAANSDPYELTKIAFEYADPVNQIMERKYSKNPKIVKCALKAIKNVKGSRGLNAKRTLYGKAINNILGMYCLDVLNDTDLTKLFENEINRILATSYNDTEEIDEE